MNDKLDFYSEALLVGGDVETLLTSTPEPVNWLEHAVNDTDDCLEFPASCFPADGFWNTSFNASTTTVLPPSLGFDDNAKTDIIIYSVMFVVAAVGNLTVFITLFRNRHRKSRVNLMIMHLAAADLMVTLINFPLEVGWRITTQWVAGNLACKLFQFLRAFGLYLSSLVLVCISLDRYFAIVHPLKVNDAQRRGKLMLSFAWSIAAVCSLPQSVIFHVDTHPVFQNFKQCVTFGFFRTQVEEMTYNLFCLAAMYFMPLFVIIVVYFRILWEISQKSRDSREERDGRSGGCGGGRMRLRRSDMSNIERARARTLRMTVIIVLAFIWCWTPYVVIVMWYMFDRESAEQVDKRLQDALFIMAVSNSCVNPLVYGTYTINFRNELNRCFGRKTKPPVLARKSTGSTAMRTTVTAQLTSTGNTFRMSTHTQVVHRDGSAHKPSGENHCLPSKPRPPLSPTPTTISKFPVSPPLPNSSTSPTSGNQIPAASTAASTMATGCVIVEIDVDVDNTTISEDTTTCPTECILKTTAAKQSVTENKLSVFPNTTETQDYVKESMQVTSVLPPNGGKQIPDNRAQQAKQTTFCRAERSPITHIKCSDGKDSHDFAQGTKLSAGSGMFSGNKYRRPKLSSLTDIISDHSGNRNHLDQRTSIELKSIRPLNNML